MVLRKSNPMILSFLLLCMESLVNSEATDRYEGAQVIHNQLWSSYLTIVNGTVEATFTGVASSDPRVAWIKEARLDPYNGMVVVRLYSPLENRHLCFNSVGGVIAVVSDKVVLMARRCLFLEEIDPERPNFVSYTSRHNPYWKVGVSSKRRGSSRSFSLCHACDLPSSCNHRFYVRPYQSHLPRNKKLS